MRLFARLLLVGVGVLLALLGIVGLVFNIALGESRSQAQDAILQVLSLGPGTRDGILYTVACGPTKSNECEAEISA